VENGKKTESKKKGKQADETARSGLHRRQLGKEKESRISGRASDEGEKG